MARIVYGVTGQGFGHVMRSQVVIDHLISRGHEVTILAYGQAYTFLKTKYKPHKIEGMHLIYKNNAIDYLATVFHDTKRFPSAVRCYHRMSKVFKKIKPEVVVSDYEPMSSLLAHQYHIPLISVGNHHFITNTKNGYPRKFTREMMTVRMVTEAMTPAASAYVVTSIADVPVKNKKTVLVPPIVSPQVVAMKPEDKGFILVYVTSPMPEYLEIFKAMAPLRFRVYGMTDCPSTATVTCRPFSREGFLEDMRQCHAVVSTAGFTTISESLYLHKPMLVVPVHQHGEQQINAWYVDHLGYGESQQEVTVESFNHFLAMIPQYRATLRKYPSEGNVKAFGVIDGLIGKYTEGAV